MGVFNYQARTKTGELQVGTVEAVSRDAAIDILHQHKLVVTGLEAREDIPLYFRKIEFFQHVTKKELVGFSRQLAVLFEAEVPVIQALRTLGDQTPNPYFKAVISEILSDVDGGEPFSRALAKHSDIFSHFYVSMVRTGEVSGKLQETLKYLADHIERDYQITNQIRNALVYPAFVVVGFIVVGVLMMVFVVPQLTAVLREAGQDLPLLTRIFIGVSDFLRAFVIPLLLLAVFLSVLGWQYGKTREGRAFFDSLILKIPILGEILKNTYIARFSENLGTLIVGGLPISQALTVTADTVGNTSYRKVLEKAEEVIRRGGTISSVLKQSPQYFPPLVGQMVATGEKTGKLDFILSSLARFYKQEVNTTIDNLLVIIEPVLIVFLGLAVGALVASILIPIYNLVEAI